MVNYWTLLFSFLLFCYFVVSFVFVLKMDVIKIDMSKKLNNVLLKGLHEKVQSTILIFVYYTNPFNKTKSDFIIEPTWFSSNIDRIFCVG